MTYEELEKQYRPCACLSTTPLLSKRSPKETGNDSGHVEAISEMHRTKFQINKKRGDRDKVSNVRFQIILIFEDSFVSSVIKLFVKPPLPVLPMHVSKILLFCVIS